MTSHVVHPSSVVREDAHHSNPRGAPPIRDFDWPEIGRHLLSFRLLEVLGVGSFGRVYLAQQEDLAGRFVALKITPQPDAEAFNLARLQHTNIVPIHSVHRVDDFQILCMPYFGSTTFARILYQLQCAADEPPSSGSQLLKILRESRPRPQAPVVSERTERQPPVLPAPREPFASLSFVNAVLWLTARLAEGLDHAHRRGILHCDLKPANILLADDGTPMLLDFNVAVDQPANSDLKMHQIGGTLPYMAPEHLLALITGTSTVEARSDLYSLGVILFQMLTGQLPYPAIEGAPAEVAYAMHLQRLVPPIPPRRLNPAISPAANSIVMKLLEPQPDRRYAGAAELREDLDNQLNDRPLVHAANASFAERFGKWRRRHPYRAPALLVSATLLVFAIAAATRSVQFNRARVELARTNARDRFRSNSEMLQTARILLSTQTPDRAMIEEGMQIGTAVVQNYGLGKDAEWMDRPGFRLLENSEQVQLRRDLGELLLLMSRAEQLRHPSGGLEEALAWNQLAEQCLEPNDRPTLMARQRNELNGLLSKKDKNPVAGINDRSDATLDLYFDGLDLAIQKKFPEALRRLIPFTEKRPSHFMGWYVRGICHDGMAQHVDAIAAFDVCVALKPQFAWSHFARGLARLHGQRYDVAAEDFTEALKLHSNWRSALIDRALAFEGSARLEEAEHDLTEALKQPDVPTRVYLLRSRIRKAKGDLVGAESDRKTGLAAEPTDALSWNARGIWNLESDPEQALHDFDQALKSDPCMFEAMKNKAYVLADKLRRPNDAVAVLDELLKIYPDCVEARAGRGVYLARLGEIDRARADARECLKHDRSPFLLYQLAGLYAQLTRVDKQGGSKEKALEMFAGAFRGGFNQFAVVNSDPDLNPLRSDPEFKTILEHARGQARPNSR